MKPLRTITLELTSHCLLRCEFCSSMSNNSMWTERSGSHWCDIINDVSLIGCKEVILSGGEPTLHPAIERIMGLVIDKSMKLTLYTSGVTNSSTRLCGPRVSSRTDSLPVSLCSIHDRVDIGVVKVVYPIHGMTTTHDEITGVGGSYYTMIQSVKNSINLGYGTEFGIVLTKFTTPHLDYLADLAYGMGVNSIRLLRLSRNGRGSRVYESYEPSHIFMDTVGKFVEKWLGYVMCGANLKDNVPECNTPCRSGMEELLVRSDGIVVPCAGVKYITKLGDTASEGITSIWNGARAELYRSTLSGHYLCKQ